MVPQRRAAAPRRDHVVPGELQPGGGGADAGGDAHGHIPDTGAQCRSLRPVHIQPGHDLPLHRLRGGEWLRIRGPLQRAPVTEGTCDALPEELAGGAQRPAEDDARVSGKRDEQATSVQECTAAAAVDGK